MNEGAAIRALDINDLPVEVLCCIISMIPFKEAVRTSVLSKRWKYLFTLIPNLDIEMDIKNIGEEEMKRWMNFVDRLVLFREMTSIRRFCLRSRSILDPQRLDKWICALVRHKIQQLDLRTLLTWVDRFLLPASLFSCESLTVLNLRTRWRYDLKIPSRIFLPHLKSVCFKGLSLPNDGSEDRFFTSCPVLEDLAIKRCHFRKGCIGFSISNQNLKTLTLKYMDTDDNKKVSILIKAPSLTCLNYYLSRFYSPVFVDVKSLVEAFIDSSSSSWHGCASDILKGIQNIQTLRIKNCLLQDLLYYTIRIPKFSKLTCLEVSYGELKPDSDALDYFLTWCDVLESLELHLREKFKYFEELEIGSWDRILSRGISVNLVLV